MSRPLDGAVGQRMDLPAYYADFKKNFSRTRKFWKLERGQTFAEPGDPSWEAFDRGDWEEAMQLLENRGRSSRDSHPPHTNSLASANGLSAMGVSPLENQG
jgi:hypothetical protein